MDINYDKLLQAIELVAFNRLDECRDDTLIEKLITVFDLSFDSLKCSNQQLNKIFNLCKQSIDKWQTEEKSRIFVGPVFSFSFKLISLPDVQNLIGQQSIVEQIEQLIVLMNQVFVSDYSIQTYYIKGLTKLFSNLIGSQIVFEQNLIDEQFVSTLINLGIKSKSFFVKEAIQQCIVELLTRTCERDDEMLLKYFKLIISSFEIKINKFQIKIISQLFARKENRFKILRLFPNLNFTLINHVNCQTDENVNLQLIELLASNLDDESQISFVFTKLIKNNLLKALITFSTNLASRNSLYIDQWFTYVVLPLELYLDSSDLVIETDQNDCSNTESTDFCFNYTELNRQFVKSLTNEKSLIYCLHYLKVNFPTQLTDQQLNRVFKIIDRFVRVLIQQSKIKLLRESLLMIGNVCKQIDQLEPELFGISVDLLISLLWSENYFQCECLIWLRHLLNNKSKDDQLIQNEDIRMKLVKLIDQLLNLELKDENLDVIDGGLELLDTLIKNHYLKLIELDESTLRLIFKIWNYSIDHCDNYSLKASCISVLFNLQLQLDESTISRLWNDEKNSDKSQIVWTCLKDENSLVRRKVIESIKENVLDDQIKNEMIDKLFDNDAKLFLAIFYHVSETLLFDIDTDIQLASINLLKNLIVDLLNNETIANQISDEIQVSKVKFKGLIYFVHSLHSTIDSNLVCFTVKEECLNVLQIIKNCLDQNSMKKSDLLSLADNEESVFEYQVSSHKQVDEEKLSKNSPSNEDGHKRRDGQLNEMFKDNIFRTEEIISQFTKERAKQMDCSDDLVVFEKTLITNKKTVQSLLDFLYSFDANTFVSNEIKVDFLDDILAARANDDVIIDCY